MSGPRIVSLMPAATEWLTLFGAADLLVGGTADCPAISGRKELPVVMNRAAATALSVTATEPVVRSFEEDVDGTRIAHLSPDLIIANGWDEQWDDASRSLLGDAAAGRAEVWWWEARTMRDVLELALRTGHRIGRFERAMKVMGDREQELRVCRDRIGLHRRAPNRALTRTVILSSLDPPVLAGGWTAELVDRAALLQMGPASGRPAEEVTWEVLDRLNPALVVAAVAPADWERAERAADLLGRREGRRFFAYDPAGRLDSAGPGLHEAILDLSVLAHDLQGRDLGGRARRL